MISEWQTQNVESNKIILFSWLLSKAAEAVYANLSDGISRTSDQLHFKKFIVHASQVAHQAGAYPGFCSMKWLGVFLLP